MDAKGLPTRIAVEQRRKDAQRQRRRDEQWRLSECVEDHLAGSLRGQAVFGQLQIMLGKGRLVAGGDVAIDPVGGVDQVANGGDAGSVE